jgi:radical SAM superfamily enzyme YgiQ (UPF0313 family)/predicted negative regulator of RcsB-dependent stress response
MNILLVYRNNPALDTEFHAGLMPVGLPLMAALLRREGHDARLANFSGLGREEMAAVLRRFRPSLVGVSQLTHNRVEAVQVAELAKSLLPGAVVALGGPHATFRHEEVLLRNPAVDLVVRGEGEETVLALARAIEGGASGFSGIGGIAFREGGGVRATPAMPRITLDDYPPALEGLVDAFHVDRRRQGEFIITSRGCPARCSFCSSPSFWPGGLRFRSAEAMLAEIQALRDSYGLIYFSIRDDTFTTDRNRVLAFCQGLLDRELHIMWNCQSRVSAVDRELLVWMRRAGCECIQFGVESGSPAILAALGKGSRATQVVDACRLVREVGMSLALYLIAGVPEETEADIDATLALVRKVRPHEVQVSPLAYYPGTPLFLRAVRDGKVPEGIFASSREPGIFVCTDAASRRRYERLLSGTERLSRDNGYTPADMAAQRRVAGYAAAGSLAAGDWWFEKGDVAKAEDCYREICRRQPRNPWGWLALGELMGNLGRGKEAEHALHRVTELVPNHAPAYTMLGEAVLLQGRRERAISLFSRALSLDPHDQTAADLLAEWGGKRKRAKP